MRDINELRPIRNSSSLVGRAAAWRVHWALLSERNRTGAANGHVAYKQLRIDALKLALEQPVELCVLRGLLAVRNGEGVGGVTRLLDEHLRERDHVGVVLERLCEIDHLVSGILLVAVAPSREEGRESGLGEGVALVSATSSELFIPRGEQRKRMK